jgi:ubiquitin carboxyl-terminal hydrolase 8
VHAHSVTGETIEDSLSVAPRDEWVLFCNRNKFDLVAIYDDDSEMPGPPDALLARLIRAIYETAFRKILKRVPVLLIGGLEAWKRHYGDQELVVERAPVAPIPVTAPLVSPPPQATEAYVQSSPQPPVSQLAPVSRNSPPNAASTSPQPETVRSLFPVPRSPFPNRTMAGTQSISDARPSPVLDSHPCQSFDQGAVSPRYGSLKWCIPSGNADHVLPHSVAESNDVPPETVRRVQRKPTMTRPPSVPLFPHPMSDGVSLYSRF